MPGHAKPARDREGTMLQIKKANMESYEKVRDFYYSLTDAMEGSEFPPGWKRDVYPTQEYLCRSIKNGELFFGDADGRIVSCMIVNHEYNDGYKTVRWSVNAEDRELWVIHALGVHPAFSGKGIAKQMVRKVIADAQKENIRTIRLDVLEGNLPAEKAYTRLGFRYLSTIPMYYEDTGWTNFKIYEYVL